MVPAHNVPHVKILTSHDPVEPPNTLKQVPAYQSEPTNAPFPPRRDDYNAALHGFHFAKNKEILMKSLVRPEAAFPLVNH